MNKKSYCIGTVLCASLMLGSCMSSSSSSASGGELTGIRGVAYSEPVPYGMVAVKSGYLKVGLQEQDSLWGDNAPAKEVSVDGFWMDETEVSNAKYRQFVFWVRDSIIRERLADPAYGGDETYKIEEDKFGNPVKPHLNWSNRFLGANRTRMNSELSKVFMWCTRLPE